MSTGSDPVAVLRDPATIRARAHLLLDLGKKGELRHFSVNFGKLGEVADFVATVIRGNYPDLQIPYHEVGIASNRGSARHGEYVPGSCTHRPSSDGSWFHLKPGR